MSSQIYTFIYIATICNLAIYMPDFALQNINNIPHCLCFIYFHFLSFMPGLFCIVLQIEVCTCKLENCKKKIQQFQNSLCIDLQAVLISAVRQPSFN